MNSNRNSEMHDIQLELGELAKIYVTVHDDFYDIIQRYYCNYMHEAHIMLEYPLIECYKHQIVYKGFAIPCNSNTVLQLFVDCVEDFLMNQTMSNLLIYHMGAICYRNMIIGISGSTHSGKSTLVAKLTQFGCEYINDDIIAIDTVENRIIPYYKPIHLRSDVVQIFDCDISITPLGIDTYYFHPSCVFGTTSKEMRCIDAIMQISYGEKYCAQEVKGTSKIMALLQGVKCFVPRQTGKLVRDVFNNIAYYNVSYENFDDIILFLEMLVNEDVRR